ncbi:hypothetical protein A3C32_00040 [Candidatus Daviesbacteria bacterium RIFCSPHIGHO2_02_FULL_41_14]|uniref:Uncharacterized protein n=1 Tax=Candidatus Daviesbacteria bacterium RIFCSPLOWO2_01_FULL_40_24 TaxID=1797787 RepID=A0A1F5MIL7_9BACT|nr:MAG: hypothetical protein A3C32_00040 [Candidatus Daviesbacteria bacterium RIFCSPHIGHO2_02_FULL_41_14]OGE65227.1 MAG: hypothetical protein A3B49_02235 [Candidatus Daviesbacteria bacterium RIFCSPLOWO2_01_FULL_40_24]
MIESPLSVRAEMTRIIDEERRLRDLALEQAGQAKQARRRVWQKRYHDEQAGRLDLQRELYLYLRGIGLIGMIAEGTATPAWLWKGNTSELEPENQPIRNAWGRSPEAIKRLHETTIPREWEVTALSPELDKDSHTWSPPLVIRCLQNYFGHTRTDIEKAEMRPYRPYAEITMDDRQVLTVSGADVFANIYLPADVATDSILPTLIRPLALALVRPFQPEIPHLPRLNPYDVFTSR